ncbi:MAG: restriction endonuclease subunit S [Bacteroides uniformis]
MTTTINNEHKKLNVPNLRFPEFEGEWEKCTFDKIAQYKKGPFGSALKKDIFVPQSKDTIKVYEQQNAIKKDWTLSRYYITKGYFNSHMKQFVAKAGDLIVSCAGTIGEIYELPQDAEEGVFNQALMRVQVNDEAVNKEIFITVFSSMIDKFSKIYSNGSAIKNIPPFADLKKTQVFLPCKEEQKKIAKLLVLLDERIATQNKIIDKLQSLIKGIRNDVFGKLRKNIGFNAVVGDVLDYEQPQSYIVEDTEYTNEGTPVLTANKAFVLGYTSETNGIYDQGDCIIFDDFTLDCKYVDFPFKVKSSAIKILTAKNKELLRYTFEFLKYLDLSTEEHKRHYIAETQNQEIILPTEQMVKTIAHIFSILSLRMETAVKQRNVFEKQKQYLLRQMFI